LSNAIKIYRKIRNISQAELAKAIGIDRPTLSHIEVGTLVKPTTELLIKIARTLKCTIADLVAESDIPENPNILIYDKEGNLIENL